MILLLLALLFHESHASVCDHMCPVYSPPGPVCQMVCGTTGREWYLQAMRVQGALSSSCSVCEHDLAMSRAGLHACIHSVLSVHPTCSWEEEGQEVPSGSTNRAAEYPRPETSRDRTAENHHPVQEPSMALQVAVLPHAVNARGGSVRHFLMWYVCLQAVLAVLEGLRTRPSMVRVLDQKL